jgi:hypothetical protein
MLRNIVLLRQGSAISSRCCGSIKLSVGFRRLNVRFSFVRGMNSRTLAVTFVVMACFPVLWCHSGVFGWSVKRVNPLILCHSLSGQGLRTFRRRTPRNLYACCNRLLFPRLPHVYPPAVRKTAEIVCRRNATAASGAEKGPRGQGSQGTSGRAGCGVTALFCVYVGGHPSRAICDERQHEADGARP